MKALSTALHASINAESTSLCRLLTIALTDGVTVFRLADHDVDVVYGNVTYTSTLGFDVSSISVASGASNSSFAVQLLLGDTFVTRGMIQHGQLDKARLTVEVIDYLNPNGATALYYQGTISQISYVDDMIATVQVVSLLTQNTQIGAELYTYTCDADLGDSRCKVDVSGIQKTFTITEVVNKQVFKTDLTQADKFWVGGLCGLTTGQSAGFNVEIGAYTMADGILILKLPMPFSPVVGDTGTVYPGCDKTPYTCFNVYSNMLNYRGVPIGLDPDAAVAAQNLPDSTNEDLPVGEQPIGTIALFDATSKKISFVYKLPTIDDTKEHFDYTWQYGYNPNISTGYGVFVNNPYDVPTNFVGVIYIHAPQEFPGTFPAGAA